MIGKPHPAEPEVPVVYCDVCGAELCITDEVIARVDDGRKVYCGENAARCEKACGHASHAYDPWAERHECCGRRRCDCKCSNWPPKRTEVA